MSFLFHCIHVGYSLRKQRLWKRFEMIALYGAAWKMEIHIHSQPFHYNNRNNKLRLLSVAATI